MDEVAVALRSQEPDLIDAVRTVLAVGGLPLAVYPPGAAPPRVGLALDDGGSGPGSPPWQEAGRRFAWVGSGEADAPPGALALPTDAEQLLALARSATRVVRARVVGVVGARGGVGASVFAAALARIGAARGLATALVDGGDGAPLDLVLGLEESPGLRWADLGTSGSGFDPVDLAASLPTWHGVRVLSGDHRPAGTGSEGVHVALAQAHDLVVLDLTRQEVHAGFAARWCDHVALVSTCDVLSATAARTVAVALAGLDVRVVVRGPSPGGLAPRDVAEACAVPLVAEMRSERTLTAGLERGVAPGDRPRGALMRAARRVVAELELDS